MKTTSLTLSGFALLSVVLVTTGANVPTPRAGAVTGQVTITERPGEVTEDIGDVIVFLEPVGTPAAKMKPQAPVKAVIALQSRQFSPRVRVISEGSKVEFPNQDPFNHNVFSKVNGGFDTGVYGRGKMKDQMFKDAGVYSIYCNVHPRMTGFVVTLNTPYFSQADASGRYTIENVPAGQYKMTVWHDRATAVTMDVTVSATGLNQSVKMDARGYKYVQHKDKNGKDYSNAAGDRY